MSAWINTDERLPELVDDGYDLESAWVLARTDGGEVYVARLRQSRDWSYIPVQLFPAAWIARGPDGYQLGNVVAWAEIPS